MKIIMDNLIQLKLIKLTKLFLAVPSISVSSHQQKLGVETLCLQTTFKNVLKLSKKEVPMTDFSYGQSKKKTQVP